MRRPFVFFGICLLVALGGVASGERPLVMVAALAIGPASLILVILVHELGHAAVARIEGLPLRWLAAGPVMIDFGHGRRLRRSPFGGAGGAVVCELGGLSDQELAGAWCRMSAGGPVASLLFAVICLGLVVAIPGLPPFVATALQWLGGLSLFGGIANAIPFRAGPFRSDGCTYLILLRGGEPAASLVRAFRLSEPVYSPAPPADWPEATVARWRETMRRLEAPGPAYLDEWLTSAYLLYWHYADRELLDDARSVLWRAAMAPRQAGATRRGRYDAIDVVTAVHLALWDRDAVTAEQIAAQVPKRSVMRRNSLWFGLEAAILLARGDARAARKKAERAQRRLAPFVDLSGVNVLEQQWWSILIARADAAVEQAETMRAALATAPTVALPIPVGASAEWAFDAPSDVRPFRATEWSVSAPPVPTGRYGAGLPNADSRVRVDPPGGFPLPTVTRAAPNERARSAVSPVPVALVKAAGAATVLLSAAYFFMFLVAGAAAEILGEERVLTAGCVGLAVGGTMRLGLAAWIWKQAGAVWGLLGLLILELAFPLYVYKQNRGMRSRVGGEPVRTFRTAATFGALVLTSLVIFVSFTAYVVHRDGTESFVNGYQTEQVR
ncbi:MAG TPA: M50 family metallopeptidase [Thermomicrobiales bacterium]|jgi:hypothetical protein